MELKQRHSKAKKSDTELKGDPPQANPFWRHAMEYVPSFLTTLKITSLTLFLFYIGVPIFVKSNSWILPRLVFANLLRWPPYVNLSSPSDFGLNGTRQFYLPVNEDVTIGTWHVLPQSVHLANKDLPWDKFENELNDGKKVFLYLHGNSGTRGSHHRVQLYKLLSALDFHVVTIDYRGYGDSTGSPTEEGVVADAYFTYKWMKQRVGGSPIYLWGHSLGTGVTSKLAKKLCDEGDIPAGVVLESPFNNMKEAATYHPFAYPFRSLPGFDWIFLQGMGEQGIYFQSDENILSVTSHVMILHAKDDLIVPFHLGKKLYESAKASRKDERSTVDFVPFEGDLGYGHKLIYQAPEMEALIRDFIVKADRRD